MMEFDDDGQPGQIMVRDASTDRGWRWAYPKDDMSETADAERGDPLMIALWLIIMVTLYAIGLIWWFLC